MNVYLSTVRSLQVKVKKIKPFDQPIVDVTISATSSWVDRTVNCIVTPSASASLDRTSIS